MARKKRILIAPLNWGLGHASRCIPVIERFRAHGAEPVLAADGRPYTFLKNELPDDELHLLRDLEITYAGNASMVSSIVRQAPHIVSTFLHERRTVDRLVSALRIDGIVSDNRFGLYSSKVPCVYMTHQVSIMTPRLFAWTQPLLRLAHASLMKRYTECWVPDSRDAVNLSGLLSHGRALPEQTYFIGPLSRLRPARVPIRYDCAIVLSGPEPQRTIFETIIRRQIAPLGLRAIIVQGIPESGHECATEGSVEIVPSLTAVELNRVMNASACIVARSGYSTIMDLAALGKQAVLVPTPGQTEQEYLARRLSSMNIFYSERQEEFDLARALERSHQFSGWNRQLDGSDTLDERIGHFLSLITT
ncbi:MAG: glycosyltransferase [Acidobacteriota bacterium]